MKSPELDFQLKSFILKNYNKAVFYTYIGVVVIALLTAWYSFEIQKEQIIDSRQEQVDRHVKQIDLLLESTIRAVTSLRNIAVEHLRLGEMVRQDSLPKYEKFDKRGQIFTLEPSYANSGKPFMQMGRISGIGSLQNRSQSFYQEMEMLFELSLSFPVAMDAAPKATAIYYISKQKVLSYFPWPKNNLQFTEELFHKQYFKLATPKLNPDRKVFWTDAYMDSTGKGLMTTVGVPIYLKDKFIGAVYLDMTLASLAKQIRTYFKMQGTVILLDQSNNVLSHSGDNNFSYVDRAIPISQKLPNALRSIPESELFSSVNGMIKNGYYIHSIGVNNAPWRLLYIQNTDDLFNQSWEKLEWTFFIVVGALSLLVSIVHWLTRRAFVTPASKLLEHLEACSKLPQPVPNAITRGWEPWFLLVSRIFEENQKNTDYLADQNKRLDKLVAKRTTRLKETNEKREQEYALLRSLLDAIPDAIVFKNKNGDYLGCNHAAEKLLGLPEDDIIGIAPETLTSLETGKRIRDEDQQVLKLEKTLKYQERMDKHDKSVLLDITKIPFYNSRGELLGLIAMWRDITREYESAEQLRQSEERYHLAMDAVEDGLWDWYVDSKKIICNPAYYSMLGYQFNEFPATLSRLDNLIHPDDKLRVQAYRKQYLADPAGSYEVEFRMQGKDQQYHWLLSRGRIVEFTHDHRPVRMLGTHKDITRHKSNEVSLLEAKQDAEMANLYKSEFLANMSHEIRTPMNAIIGMLQLAGRTSLTAQQQDYLDKASYSAQSLLRIINDILDFSKIEAGKLELEKVLFPLDKVLDHALDLNVIRSQEKGVELLLYAPVSSGIMLKGDPLRLGQVLINLLSNAVKFTSDGEIELGCEDLGEKEGRISLKFWVRDTGIGISQSQQEKLFDAFSQADGSTTRKYGGTGLGLSISKHLVSMMGGKLKVNSEVGQGSTFSFIVNFEIEYTGAQLQQNIPNQLKKLRTLVIDDNPSALQMYSSMMREFHFQVATAASGAEALYKIQQMPVDFILLDWMMPELDGMDVVASINKLVEKGKLEKLPVIIMMTAHTTDPAVTIDDKKIISSIMQKPFTSKSLYDEIIKAFNQPKIVTSSRQEATQPLAENTQLDNKVKGKILLVEDNFINQQVASELLKSGGYEVVIASDGKEALAKVDAEKFDIVLMDIQMPVMDGLTATMELRKKYSPAQLPVIAMTAHAMSGDKDKSLAAGMNAHITKPIDLDELFSTLSHWMNHQ